MKTSPGSNQKSKVSLSTGKKRRKSGGYNTHALADKHEVPQSCYIKPRDIKFVSSSIFLLVP